MSLFYYEKTDSTNTRAKLFARSRSAEDKSPAVFLSRAQSAGRGTRGRSFESPVGAGIYLSLLLYPDIHAKNAQLLTSAAAVAVCRVIERLAPDIADMPRIKWVNDVYLGRRKLAGILTEGECDADGRLRYAVIGIGLNIRRGEHTPEVEAIMTTLEDAGVSVDPYVLAAELVSELTSLLDGGSVLDEYRARSMLIGEIVEISSGGETSVERVIGIDGDCALITEDGEKNTKKYISGDVTIRRIGG